MSEGRPDPDAVLAGLQASQPELRRGRLKIFLGMCAGVGKTYAMLEAGRVRGAEGVDVVGGVIETHGRGETEALLLGHDLLPMRKIDYRGIALQEFDIDACLARRPNLVLLDELAHTNAPGSRHEKRWQDVQELRAAGINVYTTLNIQHIESLNDVVAQITGVTVRETVPDLVVEQADEIELVDLNPEELLKRLQEGLVYVPQQARLASEKFFRLPNLVALREIALRYVAERVDRQVQAVRLSQSGAGAPMVWPVRERLLVCVTPAPQSARLVRATRRLAVQVGAEWHVIHVETRPDSKADQERLHRILRLAEQLGAKTATISGTRLADDLIAYARNHNVTKIVLGKTAQPGWKRLLFGTLADALARRSAEIDLYIISGEGEAAVAQASHDAAASPLSRSITYALLAVALCTAVCKLFLRYVHFSETNIAMLFLAAVVLVAVRGDRLSAIVASFLSVAAFDFFFVPPVLTFAVQDIQYLLTFAVMLVVALLVSNLTVRVRIQAQAAQRREARTAAQLELTSELTDAATLPAVIGAAVRRMQELFDSRVAILFKGADGRLAVVGGDPQLVSEDREIGVAHWVAVNRQPAGLGTATLPSATCLHVPMEAADRVVGVVTIRPRLASRFAQPQEFHLLESFANQTALAAERVRLAEEASRSQVQAETERMRSTLLSSVSHDLRTPLASILGAASSLVHDRGTLDSDSRHELARAIFSEAERLDRLVRNLLDMTRLEAGGIQLKREWHPPEEIVGAAIHRIRALVNDRPVTTRIPADLPMVPMDGALIEQALINLLENAAKYSAPGTPIEIVAERDGNSVRVAVLDRGPGIPHEELRLIFDKFQRGQRAGGAGAGLGLAICEAIVRAHGGRIWAENRPGGGSSFQFTLPIVGQPPVIVPEEEARHAERGERLPEGSVSASRDGS